MGILENIVAECPAKLSDLSKPTKQIGHQARSQDSDFRQVLVTSLHIAKVQKIGLCNSINETRISREAEGSQEKGEALKSQNGFEDKSSLLHNLARMYL